MMQRWDANQDGQLTQEEIPARARPAIQKLARKAGLNPEEGLPLDSLFEQVRRETSPGEKAKDSGAPRTAASQAEPAGEEESPPETRSTGAPSGAPPRRAAGFGASVEVRSAKGFGGRDSSTPMTASRTRSEPSAADSKKEGKQPESPPESFGGREAHSSAQQRACCDDTTATRTEFWRRRNGAECGGIQKRRTEMEMAF